MRRRKRDTAGVAIVRVRRSPEYLIVCWKLLVAAAHSYALRKFEWAIDNINGYCAAELGAGFRPCGELRLFLRRKFSYALQSHLRAPSAMPLERSAFNSPSHPYISWLNERGGSASGGSQDSRCEDDERLGSVTGEPAPYIFWLNGRGGSVSGGSQDSLCEDDERLGSATGEPAPREATSKVEEAYRASASASGGSSPHSPSADDLGMGSASGESSTTSESSTSGESSDQVPPMVMISPAPKVQRPHAGLRILGTLGKGAFGTVSKCVWKGRVLAMKLVKRVRTAERELSIHTHLHQQAPPCAEIAHLKACRKMPSGAYRFFFEAFASDMREYLFQKRAHAAPIAIQQAMRFALDLSSGLAHLHGRQVAHRDLKPGNVLLRSREPLHACQPVAAKTKVSAGQQSDFSVLWQAVIGDFGNSAVLQHPLAMATRRGLPATQLRGERQALTRRVATLWYAAPELLVPGERYDFSLDLWAFGVVLLEIERKLPVCATHAGAADWTQLEQCWRLLQPVAAKGSFAERALHELRRHDPFPLTRVHRARHGNYQPGVHYGSRFRQYCWSALCFEAGERIKARDLWRNNSTSLALHDDVLPAYWILD